MRFSKWTIYIVIAAVALCMAGLIYVQLRIFKADVKVYEQQFNLTIPEYLSELQDEIRHDEAWVNMVNEFDGEQEAFTIESFEKRPGNEILGRLKDKIDFVFEKNNLSIEYEIKGLIASNHRCFYYSEEMDRTLHPFINEVTPTDHFLCLCGPSPGASHGSHGAGNYTAFDISFNYPNFISENAAMLRVTILLLLVLVLAFAYTVITINRQKKLSQLKNDFINNLTHEFKTPIFSISLASGLLKRSEKVKESEKLFKYAELIDNEGQRLKSQVDKILQMALIDSGNFKLEKKQLDLHELIGKVAKNFELVVNERDGLLKLDLHADMHVIVADETHLNNIIYNLLDNAVKYTDEKPEITVSTVDSDKGIELRISDNGIGMGEDVQKFVFDKFYRAESGNLHNVKGFGLGLSYVKSVIDAHKGRIILDSKRNKGSEFSIFLPAK
ncbi:MAG: HAMP domain-containing histidine kinase [Roseivirga sp.]|nr:HAMP domain-containing histidine kinase [Roseivirga sp.]